MEKGLSFDTRYVLEYLGPELKKTLEDYADAAQEKEYLQVGHAEEIDASFGEIIYSYIEKLSYDEQNTLRSYTGYEFKNINATLRNKWNYEENGLLTEEKKTEYRKFGEDITKVIAKFPSLGANIKTYRGTSIRNFWDYGIQSLDELPYLIGNYLYEPGFTSTALIRENSFFVKQPEYGSYCNIEIEYLVPGDSSDGALLHSDELSYSKSQTEYVFNSGSLFKVTSVKIDKENDKAYITAVIMPKSLWDPLALEDNEERKF